LENDFNWDPKSLIDFESGFDNEYDRNEKMLLWFEQIILVKQFFSQWLSTHTAFPNIVNIVGCLKDASRTDEQKRIPIRNQLDA
jgi:hypothetical protein